MEAQQRTSSSKAGSVVVGLLVVIGIGAIVNALGHSSSSKSSAPIAAASDAAPAKTTQVSWIAPAKDATIAETAVLNRITADAQAGDMTATEADCTSGQDQLSDWQAVASSIPLESVRTPYLQALSEYGQAFALCSAGEFGEAATHVTAGTSHLRDTTAALQLALP